MMSSFSETFCERQDSVKSFLPSEEKLLWKIGDAGRLSPELQIWITEVSFIYEWLNQVRRILYCVFFLTDILIKNILSELSPSVDLPCSMELLRLTERIWYVFFFPVSWV